MKESITLYVSTAGSDNWSGTFAEPNKDGTDGPLASLLRARDRVREIRAEAEANFHAEILVRGGKYYPDETLTLTATDSNTSYLAYPGETPIISGGRRIDGWAPYKDNILQCKVPWAVGGRCKFRQLFVHGESQVRARFPKFDEDSPIHGGYMTTPEGDTESFTELPFNPESFPRKWADPANGEVFIWDRVGWGYTITIPIRKLDYEKGIISLAYGVRNFDKPPYFFPTPIGPGQKFFIENILEELDQPGEWCLDSVSGTLYYWPKQGDIEDAEVVAPYLDRLIDINATDIGALAWADSTVTVKDITFSGFVFTETRRSGEAAHPAWLDGVMVMSGELEQGYCGDAIRMHNAESCVIENCTFKNLGGNAVYLVFLNRRNEIRHNKITDVGSNGIALAGAVYHRAETWPRHPLFNRITDNEISRCGLFDKVCPAVFCGRSESNCISHNLIYDMPHHGINLGDDGYGRNYVEYNRIHHVCQESRDNGAINIWMQTAEISERSGHVIRFNFISDVSQSLGFRIQSNVAAIYMDEGTSNCLIYGNIMVRCPAGIHVKAKNNILENNIFYNPHRGGIGRPCSPWVEYGSDSDLAYGIVNGKSFFFPGRNMYNMSHRITRNIIWSPGILWAYPSSEQETVDKALGVVDRTFDLCDDNVYFSNDGKLTFRAGFSESGEDEYDSLAAWQEATGLENGSIVADPMFVDPDNDDFRLKPGSPALKLGFQPIDMSRIGIR